MDAKLDTGWVDATRGGPGPSAVMGEYRALEFSDAAHTPTVTRPQAFSARLWC